MEGDYEEEILCENYCDTKDDFDKAMEFIDNLQQIVIEDEFSELRNNFFEKHYKKFDDTENKHNYYLIFEEYVKQIEGFLTNELNKRIKNFNMKETIDFLIENKEQELIDEELLEMLCSLSDYNTFKNIIMDYKSDKEFQKSNNLNNFSGITIQNMKNSEEIFKNEKMMKSINEIDIVNCNVENNDNSKNNTNKKNENGFKKEFINMTK
jgi:ADP-ribosylation factor 2-binding protein